MRSFVLTLLFLVLISSVGPKDAESEAGPGKSEVESLLPPPQKGWTAKESRLFTRETLFDYIDGGAEIYLAYDFDTLLVQEYSSGENSVIVEIYQMRSSEDAFGLFSLNRQEEVLSMGQDASYGFGILTLWKDRYFVKVIDLDGKDTSKDIILSLGKGIAQRIKNEGNKPDPLRRIPQDDLVSESSYYFHKNIILKNLYFLTQENILNLSEKTDAVLASYELDKEVLKLLLVQYPDTVESRKAYEKYNRDHLRAAISSMRNLQKVGEDLYSGAELEDRYLIVVLEGNTRECVNKLLTAARKSLSREKADR